jgi:hypothetical protein
MNGMLATPPKHARITVVPGCVVIDPIDCLVFVYSDGHVVIDIEEAGFHSEGENLSQATIILSEALSSTFDLLAHPTKPLNQLLKKKQEYLSKHLKQAT